MAIYDCEQCKKKVGMLMLDRVEKKWVCAECFYKKKEEPKKKKK